MGFSLVADVFDTVAVFIHAANHARANDGQITATRAVRRRIREDVEGDTVSYCGFAKMTPDIYG